MDFYLKNIKFIKNFSNEKIFFDKKDEKVNYICIFNKKKICINCLAIFFFEVFIFIYEKFIIFFGLNTH